MSDNSENKILFYEKEFYMFSNFSSFIVEYDGYIWPTSEYAYQASKFTDESVINQIKNAKSSHEAFNISRNNEDKVKPNWSDIRVSVMEDIVRAKLDQHEYIKEKLLDTGSREIVENSPTDDFWGWGLNKDGQNQLGKIWMKLRDEIMKS
ncbi:MAG: NADAR family protein [Nitrospira sp.]